MQASSFLPFLLMQKTQLIGQTWPTPISRRSGTRLTQHFAPSVRSESTYVLVAQRRVDSLSRISNQPVLGIAVDWGRIQSTSEPAVWALGLVRNPSIQYKTSSGLIESRFPYFLSAYDSVSAAVGVSYLPLNLILIAMLER